MRSKRSGRALVATLLFAAVASLAFGATFTVINTADTGAGSLRQAILDANAAAGADTIAFNVSGAGCDGGGVCTIAPTSALPSIGGPVLIDGYTQPGASPNTIAQGALNTVLKIVLSGVNIPSQSALSITGVGGTTVRGLVMNGGFDHTFISYFSDDNAVAGCFIGTNAAGTAAVPTMRSVESGYSANFRVGGPNPADRNLISGSEVAAVLMYGSANALVEGNLVGTDITGAAPLGNGDVFITTAINIGYNGAGTLIRGNVVAATRYGDGMNVGASGSDTMYGMTIVGNWVGTDVSGTVNLGNASNGIVVMSQQIAVGGIGAGEGNVIAYNGNAGVLVSYSTIGIARNPIRGNSIHDNNAAYPSAGYPYQGIDLGNLGGYNEGGLTINDLGDADAGPNGNQNFPIITSALSSAGSTTIQGRLNSLANTQFDLDFYSNAGCLGRPQDFLEGRTYLGSSVVTTDGNGNATINAVLPVTLAAGEKVSATATDPDGNTSEFSQRIVLSSSPTSGSPSGVPVTLAGFNFLSGATATVGGLPATGVAVTNYNQITATTPSLPPGSLNNVTVTNTDGSAGTLPNGWIADFLDVPGLQQFYTYVTTLVRNAITAGVGGGNYGVAQDTLRQQMAVFLLKAKYGVCYAPPPCTTQVFTDVPCSSGFAPWINELVAEGITGGCGTGTYCPTSPVLRQQMAVLLLRTFEGSAYAPPACTTATFTDVPCSSPFAPWIYELVARNVTAGCGSGNYCPLSTANRGQMATFLTKTFSLQ